MGRMDTCICIPESLCCPPETITILLIDYTPVQNKELKEKVGRHYAVLEKCMEEEPPVCSLWLHRGHWNNGILRQY